MTDDLPTTVREKLTDGVKEQFTKGCERGASFLVIPSL